MNYKISKKVIETEHYVDDFIFKNGKPPTYQQVMEQFGLKSKSASYMRLRRYRDKMNSLPKCPACNSDSIYSKNISSKICGRCFKKWSI